MPRHCSHVRFNGISAIVCGGTKIEACCVCGEIADRLCDWKRPGGTCDRPMCSKHTHQPSNHNDKDLCPEHATAWATHSANRQAEMTLDASTVSTNADMRE